MARISTHARLLPAVLALSTITSSVSAEHLLQSIPLDSSDTGFVDAATFVHNGNLLYLAGSFYGQVDFNPNGAPSIWFSTCPTTYGCSFVVAYDANMQIAWLDLIYGTGTVGDHLLVPRTGGGVYLLLDFTDDLAYLPNTTEPVFHAPGESDIAVIGLDDHGESTGSVQFGSTGTSLLRNARPFESAPDTVDVAWANRAASGTSGANAIVSRANIGTGTITPPVLEIEASDASSYANIYDQRPDAGGRYACGIFNGNVDFDALHAHRFATTESVDAFVARYDADGALVWLSTMTAENGASCYGLAVDAGGNLWATGGFGGSAYVQYDGNPVPIDLTSWGFDDAFLLEYDALGALRTNAHLGGFGSQVFPSRIEAADDGSVTIVGDFAGAITNGFAGTLTRSSNDYNDGFLLVVNRDLTTRYFGQITYNDGFTLENSLQLSGPMQIETIAQMSMPTGGNAYLDYALPPEHALLHNDGTFASAYARYDLDAILADGFDVATP